MLDFRPLLFAKFRHRDENLLFAMSELDTGSSGCPEAIRLKTKLVENKCQCGHCNGAVCELTFVPRLFSAWDGCASPFLLDDFTIKIGVVTSLLRHPHSL